jgi:hypothetical protein
MLTTSAAAIELDVPLAVSEARLALERTPAVEAGFPFIVLAGGEVFFDVTKA